MKKIVTSALAVFFAVTVALGQHSSNAYRVLADSLYKHHHYQFAADYYEKALKKAENPGYLMLQLGKCYDKVNKPLVAEQWFRMATKKRASFTDLDYYLYAEALIAQQKYERADSLLEYVLSIHPEMPMARTALDDLRNLDRFYADSALVKINYLPLNSDVAEFSPVRFKDGLIFTSARQEGAMKKKYHWDNSHFLNLYYARKTDTGFANAEVFEKDLNTRHHDGPASFYNNFGKMIVNRNQRLAVHGREEVFEWRPGLYDATFNSKKSDWEVTLLPFSNPSYSFAHPAVSEDGNTLYFSSDMPGGYGGMDIYRVTRVNGVWGTPFNAGPVVNTVEDEVFPFFVANTLYFSSTGHGGLGGLDIFISTQTINGFSPPVNAGYPINSFSDDLSYVTDSLQREGYFASARKGNDDIYSFRKTDPKIRLLAHIYDGESLKPLSGASIQVMTHSGEDQNLMADNDGNFGLQLPKDEAYVIVGTQGDYIGMVADVADTAKHHRIPAYRDTTRLACIGFIKNNFGLPQTAAVINIIDLTTRQIIPHAGDQSIIAFLGEKGHSYHIEAIHALGNKATHQLDIAKSDRGTKEFTIILDTAPVPLPMAARVFRADDNQPIAGAEIRVLTFGEEDQQLTSGNDGIVDFALAQGQAYVVIASKDGLSGMHSGTAEVSQQRDSVIHPVPMFGDKLNSVIAMGLVSNRKGDAIDNFRATVTQKNTGVEINLQASRGLLTFPGEQGGSYSVKVEHDNYETLHSDVVLPSDGADVHRFSLIMREKAGRENNLTAPLMVAANVPATLLFIDTEDGKSKAFISTDNQVNEVREKNGELTVQQGRDNKSLGKGTIAELRTDPRKMLAEKGLSNVSPMLLRTVYFDFDKYNLDEEDIDRLTDVRNVLDNQPGYELTISGHADDRGKDSYNERLSRRRANAVARYLIAQGIDRSRIIMKAYGESRPAIPCLSGDCTEDDHRMNRRAEFLLQGSSGPELNSEPDEHKKITAAAARPGKEGTLQTLLTDYGNKSVEGVSFRVNIGAYRKKHDLSFPELAGIGTVESIHRKGITYYYLATYRTLAEAEQARLNAVEKGITDASISVYRNGDKIQAEEFAALVE